jgi:hypothetical protein
MKTRKNNVHNTESRKYKCNYCRKKYVPKKRRIQKYCSASCRSKAYHQRQLCRKDSTEIQVKEIGIGKPASEKLKIDKMSIAGVGNATIGTYLADTVRTLLTPEQNKPATKGDISKIEQRLIRFQRINNMHARPDGSLPYFDLESKSIVYLKK